MKVLLLLNRTDLKEKPAETARRRAKALSEQSKRARFEEALQAELATIQCLRDLMKEPAPRSKWRRAIAAR
jgi:hypothetical protein